MESIIQPVSESVLRVTPPALNLSVKELLKFHFMYFTFESTQHCFFLYLFFPWVTYFLACRVNTKSNNKCML